MPKMPPKKRISKRPPSDEILHAAGIAIRRMRLNQSKGILALAKKIDDLRCSHEIQDIISLLRDCGLNEDEIATYMAVTPKLGHREDRIKSQGLGYDGVRALVHASDEAIAQAMNLGNAGGPLGANEIARLRDIPERAKIPDSDAVLKLRDECFQAECVRMAQARQQSFTAMARELHIAMETYEGNLRYVRRYYRLAENNKALAKLGTKGTAALEHRGAVVRSLGETFFSDKEARIIALAKILLKEFDELFPGRAIPKSEWGLVGNENPTLRYFAEARQALVALQAGGFLGGFLSDASEHDQWDALSSIAYLAGVHSGITLSKRFSPRPVGKLNAFIVRAASGVEAVGLDAAGFRIRATYTSMSPGRPRGRSTTPSGRQKVVAYTKESSSAVHLKPLPLKQHGKRTLPNAWNLRRFQIDQDGLFSDLNGEIGRLGGQDVHLLAATLTDQPFKERGRGEDDERQQFGHAFQLLRDTRPKAFFFETSAEFRGPKHLPFRNRLAQQADDLGFAVADFQLNASWFGVPQNRPRSILMGVAKEYGSRLRQPVLVNPVHRTVGDAIADVAFGFLPEIEAIPEELRTKDQAKYRKWARTWLADHGQKSALDTLSLIRGSSDTFNNWHEIGFNRDETYTVTPRLEDLQTDSVPLSLPLLKRLQGIPDDWAFVGSERAQLAQICETTPPVIYRVIGHIIHAALTGQDVDIDLAARQTLDSKRWKRASGFSSMPESHDPARARALEWREHVLRDEEGP
ncbi:DNA cytosine methyltransferase [Ensifer sesbaniae]|uniref:DNA cytosine methyltransferase n=1 Tax=Ensifer sesbaniae TaxID=1214071 RepID=UPI00200070DB|nr:DNA cytosine methyltransferase [Ensifer sesbaniae]